MPTLRFISLEHYTEGVNLYHLARVPLSGQKATRYKRILWATDELAKLHPALSRGGIYKDLETNIR